MSHRASPGGPPAVLLSGVVLAGGRGRRFRGDKLAARLGPATVLAHCVDAVGRLCDPVVVVGGPAPPASLPMAGWLPDAVPTPGSRPGDAAAGVRGPLAGIVAGLEQARTPLVAVVAGDLPFPSTDVLAHLAASWDGEPAVIPRVRGAAQPLHAVWATAHRAAVRAAFDAGQRSPLRVADALGARFLDELPSGPTVDDVPLWTRDVDERDDLLRLRRWRAIPLGQGRD